LVIGTHVTRHVPPVTPAHARALVSGIAHGSLVIASIPTSRAVSFGASTALSPPSTEASTRRPLSGDGSVPFEQPESDAIASAMQTAKAAPSERVIERGRMQSRCWRMVGIAHRTCRPLRATSLSGNCAPVVHPEVM
jgi:hypothetical protein